MTIPQRLEDWTIGAISVLLTQGYYESEFFDFKEKLPDSRDSAGKERLKRTCCAFANSAGGFLVFGIADDRTLSPSERIVGTSEKDFPEHFGNFPQQCVPSIDWSYKNPSIITPSGRTVHVVHIPSSWRGPHCTVENDRGWRFTKRTNKGDEDMSYEEVRSGFLGIYEKKLKLGLLLTEIQSIIQTAQHLMLLDEPESELGKKYSTFRFQTTLLESTMLETYVLLQTRPTLRIPANSATCSGKSRPPVPVIRSH